MQQVARFRPNEREIEATKKALPDDSGKAFRLVWKVAYEDHGSEDNGSEGHGS